MDIAVGCAVAGAALISGSLIFKKLRDKPFKFNAPDGQYPKVGVRIVNLGPHSRARIFYPCFNDAIEKQCRYFIDGSAETRGIAIFAKLPKYSIDWISAAKINLCENEPIRTTDINGSPTQFPVLIYYHGLGGNADISQQFCVQMASRGYVTVAVESSCGSASHARLLNGEIVEYTPVPDEYRLNAPRVASVAFRSPQLRRRLAILLDEVLPTLLGRKESPEGTPEDRRLPKEIVQMLDFRSLIIGGHSFGGATAITIADWWINGGGRESFEHDPSGLNLRCIALHDPWLDCLPEEVIGLERTIGNQMPILCINSDFWDKWEMHVWDQHNFFKVLTSNAETIASARNSFERERDRYFSEGNTKPYPSIRCLENHLQHGPTEDKNHIFIGVDRSNHYSFSDVPLWYDFLRPLAKKLKVLLLPRQFHQIQVATTCYFFDNILGIVESDNDKTSGKSFDFNAWIESALKQHISPSEIPHLRSSLHSFSSLLPLTKPLGPQIQAHLRGADDCAQEAAAIYEAGIMSETKAFRVNKELVEAKRLHQGAEGDWVWGLDDRLSAWELMVVKNDEVEAYCSSSTTQNEVDSAFQITQRLQTLKEDNNEMNKAAAHFL